MSALKEIQKEQDRIREFLRVPESLSPDEYRRLAGQNEGLEYALGCLLTELGQEISKTEVLS